MIAYSFMTFSYIIMSWNHIFNSIHVYFIFISTQLGQFPYHVCILYTSIYTLDKHLTPYENYEPVYNE